MKSLSCFLFLLIGFNATAQLSGVYTIDSSKPATATNYKSIKAALDSLNKSGISNHTTFKLADGIYTDSIELDSARLKFPHFKYHIIFTSISGDSGKVTITSKDGPALLLYNTNNIYFKSIGFHSGSKYYSVFITNSDSIFFENCLITGVTATSRVMVFANFEYVNNAYLSVSHCMIANGIEGVHAEFISPNYSGIDNFKVSPKLNISYCNFNNLSKYDIYSYRINNNISDNIVHEIRIEGYHLNANGKSILLRNHFSGNINLYGLDSTVFINNVLNKNLIAMEAEVIIFHNTILGSVTESSTYQGGTYEPYIHGANNIILGMLNDDPGTHYGCYEVSFKQLRNSCFSTLSKYDCNTVNHDNRLNIYRWINETNDTTSIVDSPLFISKSDFHIMNPNLQRGIPMNQVMFDMEGKKRNPDNPTIGAYEFSSANPFVVFKANEACTFSPVHFKVFTSNTESDSIISWRWDFKDSTTSTSQSPSHFFNKGGYYNVGLIITSQKGFKDTFYSSVFIDDDCVNPGDVNGDGYIDMEDKLYIDFARHTESFNRITTNRKPGRYSCIPWLDTLPNGRNMKHADCDGNGKVYLHEVEPDYPEDDDAVYYNYDSIPRPFKINSDKITDPPLYYKLDKKFYKGGDTVYAKFRIGTYKNPIIEFMGISFTIIIPDSVIDTSRIKVDYDSSYFIDDGDKLFSSRIIKGYNRIDVLCGNNVKGNLTGDFTLIALKLPVKKAVKDSVTVKIQIGNNNQMDNKGNHVPVYVLGDYKNLGIETNGNLFSLIEIYPNPSSGKTYINSSEDNITSITLKSIEGKTVMNIENINQTKTVINTEQLPIGVYLLSVKTAKGTAQRKLILFR